MSIRNGACVILMIVLFMLFGEGMVAGAQERTMLDVQVKSYTYDMAPDIRKTNILGTEYYMNTYQLTNVEDAQYYSQNESEFRTLWIRLEVTPLHEDIRVKSLEFIRESNNSPDFVFHSSNYRLSETENTTSLQTFFIGEMRIGTKSDEEITRIIRESKIKMEVDYTIGTGNVTYRHEEILDMSGIVLDRLAPEDGFQIVINYCDIYEWETGEVLLRKYFSDEIEGYKERNEPIPYYICVLRGVKTKQMEAQVLEVSFGVEEDSGIKWIGVNNGDMYDQSINDASWCDNLYENGSQYIEIRMIIPIPEGSDVEKRTHVETVIKNLEIAAYYSPEGHKAVGVTEGVGLYDFFGPKNKIKVNLDDITHINWNCENKI